MRTFIQFLLNENSQKETRDIEYINAIKSGDLNTAQQLIDEQAKLKRLGP